MQKVRKSCEAVRNGENAEALVSVEAAVPAEALRPAEPQQTPEPQHFLYHFAPFRMIFAPFGAVLDRSESFSDRLERQTLRKLAKACDNFAKSSRIA